MLRTQVVRALILACLVSTVMVVFGAAAEADTAGSPFGHVDSMSGTEPLQIRVQGWALDPDTEAPIAIGVFDNGEVVGYLAATNVDRPDVAAAYPDFSGAPRGFDILLGFAPGVHDVCVAALNADATPGGDTMLDCEELYFSPISGHLDSLDVQPDGVHALGWARQDDAPSTPVAVAAFMDGELVAYTPAAADARPDVEAAGYSLNTGFDLTLPDPADGLSHDVCAVAYVDPNSVEPVDSVSLGCMSVTTAVLAT